MLDKKSGSAQFFLQTVRRKVLKPVEDLPCLGGLNDHVAIHRQAFVGVNKAALNADCDGQAGLQELAGNATMLFYMSEEGQEGRNAFQEGRAPDFSRFPKRP